ncbi:hypothetical protein KSD_37210 [Ktedonobacter sp. SOSP1-85]|uniref:FUSC family protein n=1 Tax=Ktedonobacter sp. SOSP1-85 TaxID=2778367 RepID=UPI001915631D|nr:FUSC family protein [Ktedonobacter sp. SOSP1-85]GHO75950.1 hypothetical protein KSD_37210 [Ktedonobacter sp. SOSP1-85]
MLGIFGTSAGRVGLLVTIVFAMVLSEEGSWQTGIYVALSMLICGLWAIVPTLLLWPLRPYQPERQAVASYYRALAVFCSALEGPMHDEGQRKALKRVRGAVWQTYNQAHSMVVAVHAGSEETPLPLQRLFLLTLHADHFFQTAISLAKFGESMPQVARVEPVRQALNVAVSEFGRVLRQVAASALNEKVLVETNELNRRLVEVKAREDELRRHMQSLMARYAAEPVGRASTLTRVHLTRLVDEEDYKGMMQVLQVLRTFHQVSNALLVIVAMLKQQDQEESLLQTALRLAYRQEVKRKNLLETLKTQFTMQSATFRHALRIGLAMGVATAIYRLFEIPHGFWIALTIMVCLKPNYSTSNQKLAQRFIGTCIGACIAAALVALVRVPSEMLLLLAVFGFIGFCYYQRNYRVFVMFIAPFSLLLNSMAMPGQWEIALLRVGCTLLGCLLSLLAVRFLWPEWERERLPKRLAKAIAANRDYLRRVLAGYEGQESSINGIHKVYKAMSLANADVASAFQSLMDEPKGQRGDVERWDALITYNQQLADCITALSAHIPLMVRERRNLPRLERFARTIDNVLYQIEETLLEGKQTQEVSGLVENLQELQATLQSLIAERLSWQRAKHMQTQAMSARRQALKDLVPMMLVLDEIAQYTTGMWNTVKIGIQ